MINICPVLGSCSSALHYKTNNPPVESEHKQGKEQRDSVKSFVSLQ